MTALPDSLDEQALSPWKLIKHDMTALDNALKEADGG